MLKQNIIEIKIDILRRINALSPLSINKLATYFTNKEIETIYILISSGEINFINENSSEEIIISISNHGKKFLFCHDNANQIIKFCNELDDFGYNGIFDLVLEFIDKQNLDENSENILTIENFVNFSIKNNIDIKNKNNQFDFSNNVINILKLRSKLKNNI